MNYKPEKIRFGAALLQSENNMDRLYKHKVGLWRFGINVRLLFLF